MPTNILIINSDSPRNKGDQAILLGSIQLIRSVWKDASITAISDRPSRDSKWFGIDFINQKVYTVNPIKIVKITLMARKFDFVFWGGGELLKDYTNKIAPIYWFLRTALLRMAGVKILGLYQGIGPSESRLSKYLIAKTVNMTDSFFVRDEESRTRLIEYGADSEKIVSGFDPAILNKPSPLNRSLIEEELGLTSEFIENSIIVSPRKWFHYSRSTWIPASFQVHRKSGIEPRDFSKYKDNLIKMLTDASEALDINIILFPMFTSKSEGDAELCYTIQSAMKNPKVIVVNSEDISPQMMISLFSLAKASVGSRLHSSIISVAAGTPSMCLYYVDKGRIFFNQIGAEKQSLPIEYMLTTEGTKTAKNILLRVIKQGRSDSEITSQVERIRSKLTCSFYSQFHEY